MSMAVNGAGYGNHSAGLPNEGQTHVVEHGDTLSQIAQEKGVSLQSLIAANPQIANPNLIYPGQHINIPGGGAAAGGGQVEAQAAAATTATTGVGDGGSGITPAQLQQIVPGMSAQKAAEVAPHLNSAMAEANINTPQRQAMFIAQLAHESGGFRYMEEIASGAAYEGRADLGNTQPGDGVRYKGRGYIQVTGRHNYTQAGRALGVDLVNNPQLAAQPENAARIAAWYWNSRNINAAADRGDFVQVTRLINGGTNGLADRQAYYGRAQQALGNGGGAPAPTPSPQPGTPAGGYTVRSGDTLSGIADRHGVSLGSLVAANPQISNPNLIHPGQHINIPGGGGGSSAPAPTPSPSAGSYTVRSGDTLSGIASRHGVPLNSLVSANPQISNPNLIYPGQNINIPGAGGSSQAPAQQAGNYTVRSGDTLSGIASRHGVSLNSLVSANPQISNPNLIYPGQNINIPGGGGSASPAPAPAASQYTVRSGDTLSGIAGRHGVPLNSLVAANPQISNPNLIYPGQTINIPGGGGAPAPSGPQNPGPVDGNNQYPAFRVWNDGRFINDPSQIHAHHSDPGGRMYQGQLLIPRDVTIFGPSNNSRTTPVPSPVSGTVVDSASNISREANAGDNGGRGNYVILKSDSGEYVRIYHFSSVNVRPGQRVEYGQNLGNQGNTGHSTGPHIHFESSNGIFSRWINDLLDGKFDGVRR